MGERSAPDEARNIQYHKSRTKGGCPSDNANVAQGATSLFRFNVTRVENDIVAAAECAFGRCSWTLPSNYIIARVGDLGKR
jgi:hypothetical protein